MTTPETIPSTRYFRLGQGPNGAVVVTVNLTRKDHGLALSFTGVEGPLPNGDARGGCGQIEMSLGDGASIAPGDGWTAAAIKDFLTLWRDWHLNDMRAGCTHQRDTWSLDEPLTVSALTWGPAYHALRRQAENGTMTAEEYAAYTILHARVSALTLDGLTRHTPKHPQLFADDVARMVDAGILRRELDTIKAAGWVYRDEHPRGWLMHPCGICGYRYGSAWLHEEIPADVLAALDTFPTVDATALPSCWR